MGVTQLVRGSETEAEQEMRGQYWLAMDTATANMTIAVMKGMEVIAANESTVERNHSVRLIPELQELVKRAGIGMKDVRAVATGRGPGSYTGVRIGVTVAKTLAWTLGCPLVSVSSIGALAFGYVRDSSGQAPAVQEGETVWVVPVLDARRKQVFTGLYSWQQDSQLMPADAAGVSSAAADGGSGPDQADVEPIRFAEAGVNGVWRQLMQDRIALYSEWLEVLRDAISSSTASHKPQRIVFVGETDHLREEAEVFAAQIGVPVTITNQAVHGRDIAWLAWHRLVQHQEEDIHGLVPNYTQLAEAEQKLLSRQK